MTLMGVNISHCTIINNNITHRSKKHVAHVCSLFFYRRSTLIIRKFQLKNEKHFLRNEQNYDLIQNSNWYLNDECFVCWLCFMHSQQVKVT